MAKIAHSTSTSTRRTLGAGLFATIIGTGITAGAAASVADLVPADPDAELIALCDQFCAIEHRHYAEAVPLWRVGDDDGADAALERMAEEHEAFVDRIANLPPQSLAGAVALARTLNQWSHGDYARGGCTDDVFARTLIRGLVGRA